MGSQNRRPSHVPQTLAGDNNQRSRGWRGERAGESGGEKGWKEGRSSGGRVKGKYGEEEKCG